MVCPFQISGGQDDIDLSGALVPDGGKEDFLLFCLPAEDLKLCRGHREQPQVTGLLEHFLHGNLTGQGFVITCQCNGNGRQIFDG